MPRRPDRAAGVLAALLLAALAACGTGDGGPQAVRESAGSAAQESTTTTSSSPASSSTTVKAGGATTTTSRATTTTRGAAGSSSPSTVAGAKALTPAAPGTYRYDTSGTTTFSLAPAQAFPAVTTLVVDPPAGTTQHSTRNLRDGAGNGPATEFTLDYRAQGIYLVALRVTVGVAGGSDSEEFRPPSPVLLLATGARPGAHTEAALPGAAGAKLAVDVLRTERVTIAGTSVDTLVMQAVVTLAPGDVTGRLQLTVNVDPVSRLWVKEQSVSDASAAGGVIRLHSQYTATIQRLTP
jgi:hypothetical protein